MKKICIISDTHLSATNDLLFSKVDAEQNLFKVVDKLIIENPDYLFVLGDISQDGSIESYQKVKTILSKINCNKYLAT